MDLLEDMLPHQSHWREIRTNEVWRNRIEPILQEMRAQAESQMRNTGANIEAIRVLQGKLAVLDEMLDEPVDLPDTGISDRMREDTNERRYIARGGHLFRPAQST